MFYFILFIFRPNWNFWILQNSSLTEDIQTAAGFISKTRLDIADMEGFDWSDTPTNCAENRLKAEGLQINLTIFCEHETHN